MAWEIKYSVLDNRRLVKARELNYEMATCPQDNTTGPAPIALQQAEHVPRDMWPSVKLWGVSADSAAALSPHTSACHVHTCMLQLKTHMFI